jgi:hypothetical protein
MSHFRRIASTYLPFDFRTAHAMLGDTAQLSWGELSSAQRCSMFLKHTRQCVVCTNKNAAVKTTNGHPSKSWVWLLHTDMCYIVTEHINDPWPLRSFCQRRVASNIEVNNYMFLQMCLSEINLTSSSIWQWSSTYADWHLEYMDCMKSNSSWDCLHKSQVQHTNSNTRSPQLLLGEMALVSATASS